METYKPHRFEKNPKELEFVEKFTKDFSESTDLIVFGHSTDSVTPKDYLDTREDNIVISVIQWLGSPVGQGFLESCGFKQENR